MKVLEIKNNLVKIAYDVKDNLVLSGFVIIEDENSPYVGQIMNLNADEETNAATVKLLFTFNSEGIVKNYDGSIPSVNAAVTNLPAKELLDIMPVKTPLKIGRLAQQKSSLKVDFSFLERDLVTCVETETNKNTLLKNFVLQLENKNKKTVIFDTDGLYDNDDKTVFGQDFKLPLNYQTIDFIYENDLEDVDAVSKAVIQDIFLEVQEYTKTVENGFIPFETFINVVDSQYRETEIPQLILLKNKLLKYKEENVFAQTLDEIESLKTALNAHDTVIIDVSVFNPKLQREIISHVYDVISKFNEEYYSFVTLTNSNSDKKLLKRFLTEENIYTNIFCQHEYKYLPELKQYASNLILFAPQTTQHDFAAYNTFLNKLNNDEFVIFGNLTQNIPFIIELEEINLSDTDNDDEDNEAAPQPQENEEPEYAVNETSMDIEQPAIEEETSLPDFSNDAYEELEDLSVSVDSIEQPELPADDEREAIIEQVAKDVDNMFYSNIAEEIPPIDEEPIEDAPIEDIVEAPQIEINSDELETTAEIEFADPENIEINDELTEDDLDFIDDISSEIQQNEVIEEPIAEQLSFEEEHPLGPVIEIVEDVEEPALETIEVAEELPAAIEDEFEAAEFLSEDNFDENELTAETFDEPAFEPAEELPEPDFIQEEEPAPVVPVYDADEFLPEKEVETFEQGDSVSHPKYGHGVVEKMIKYGNKTLCSINFDNVGRRLLDPAISEITKL